MTNRELDAWIAEKLLGWEEVDVGPDVNGENRCRILAPYGQLPEGVLLPGVGKLHRAWLVPEFTTRLDVAIRLCQQQGQRAVEIIAPLHEMPRRICEHLLQQKGLADEQLVVWEEQIEFFPVSLAATTIRDAISQFGQAPLVLE